MRAFRQIMILELGIASLSACSPTPSDDSQPDQFTSFNQGKVKVTCASQAAEAEPEGPQYQQPTMDVLRGKPQLFPARYPLRRYPHSTVKLVDVRPNRAAGNKDMVLLSSSDGLKAISEFYNKQLLAEKWQRTWQYANACYVSSKWRKGNSECEVRVAPDLTTNKMHVQLLTGMILAPVPGSMKANTSFPPEGSLHTN